MEAEKAGLSTIAVEERQEVRPSAGAWHAIFARTGDVVALPRSRDQIDHRNRDGSSA